MNKCVTLPAPGGTGTPPEPRRLAPTVVSRHNRAAIGRPATGRANQEPHAMEPTKHTIALVDDDRNILTSVSMTLEAEGFGVRTYTDG